MQLYILNTTIRTFHPGVHIRRRRHHSGSNTLCRTTHITVESLSSLSSFTGRIYFPDMRSYYFEPSAYSFTASFWDHTRGICTHGLMDESLYRTCHSRISNSAQSCIHIVHLSPHAPLLSYHLFFSPLPPSVPRGSFVKNHRFQV